MNSCDSSGSTSTSVSESRSDGDQCFATPVLGGRAQWGVCFRWFVCLLMIDVTWLLLLMLDGTSSDRSSSALALVCISHLVVKCPIIAVAINVCMLLV